MGLRLMIKKIFYAYEILNKLKDDKKINYIGISLKNPLTIYFLESL